MSSWAAKRQQEAFLLYRAYIALSLHLKPGSGFDFSMYGPNVNIKKETFVADRPKMSKFVTISAGIEVENYNSYLFANARHGIDITRVKKNQTLQTFAYWQRNYGTKELFNKTSASRLRSVYLHNGSLNDPLSIVMSLIDEGKDDGNIEAIIAYLHFKPDLLPLLQERVKENVIWEMYWNKIIPIRSMYYYLGIL